MPKSVEAGSPSGATAFAKCRADRIRPIGSDDGAIANRRLHVGEIELGEERDAEKLTVYGYVKSKHKEALVLLISIATLGLFRLLLHWFPRLLVKFTAVRSALDVCEWVLVSDKRRVNELLRVQVQRAGNGSRATLLPLGDGLELEEVAEVRYFLFRELKYFWCARQQRFATFAEMAEGTADKHFHAHFAKHASAGGLTAGDVTRRLAVYGPNSMLVETTPLLKLLLREVLSPFYVFQAFSLALWVVEEYCIYAAIIAAMSLVSIATDLYQIRQQECRLRNMAHTNAPVSVLRTSNDRGEEVLPPQHKAMSDSLVPGDILEIPSSGCVMHCDALLIGGGSAMVNESMLTGESVPVTKTALVRAGSTDGGGEQRRRLFHYGDYGRHILYCGTQVLQTRSGGDPMLRAVVLRTGFSTLKGQLVRSIMFPKPIDFSLFADIMKMVALLACIAGVGLVYTVGVMWMRGMTLQTLLMRSLDVVTIAVPPALPAVMSVGTIVAQMRLRRKQIYCIAPSKINTCGAVDVVCFDKTGTLTEDGLDFHCLMPLEKGSPPEFAEEVKELMAEIRQETEPWVLPELAKAMACCHTLARVDGKLVGDPLDLILFEQSGWQLEDGGGDGNGHFRPSPLLDQQGAHGGHRITTLHQFVFSSELQRMSVVVCEAPINGVEEEAGVLKLYCKGSPEAIAALCTASSLPVNYSQVVRRYATLGYRLIALSQRRLARHEADENREKLECGLQFMGLAVLENRLKPVTSTVIGQLTRANIRTAMITGDNLHTAMSVAEECGIMRAPTLYTLEVEQGTGGQEARNHELVLTRMRCRRRSSVPQPERAMQDLTGERKTSARDHNFVEAGLSSALPYQLALSGPTLSFLCHERPHLLRRVIACCDVYARMAPEQKRFIVNQLQEMDYTVAMCGDGANDCSALKAAHVSVSLSEAEASIAAPFTSKTPDIRCVATLLAEGRAALVTSFSAFKYMASYSLAQFASVLIVFWLGAFLPEMQFLYQDLMTLFVALFFAHTRASARLAPKPPPLRLLSLGTLVSIVGQVALITTFQLIALLYTRQQSWFIPYRPTPEMKERSSMEGTSLFLVSMFQLITLMFTYSKSAPHRRPIHTNWPLCASLLLVTCTSLLVLFPPREWITQLMRTATNANLADRLVYLVLAMVSGMLAILFEAIVVDYYLLGVRERWALRYIVFIATIYRGGCSEGAAEKRSTRRRVHFSRW